MIKLGIHHPRKKRKRTPATASSPIPWALSFWVNRETRLWGLEEHERARYDFDPTMFYENRFWNWRPDGTVINKNHRTLYIQEFKRSSDRNEDFLRVKEDEANKQPRSIIEALKGAAPEWTFEQINFVAGRRGAVEKGDFYNKLERLNVEAGKRTRFWQRMCDAYAKRMTQ